MSVSNLYEKAGPPERGEDFETLLQHRNLVVERIVSSEHIDAEPAIQSQDEWVVLLRGEARLSVNGETVTLKAGDYLFLPADTPHTVESTSRGALWLAVHLHSHKSLKLERQRRWGRWGLALFLLTLPAGLLAGLLGYPPFTDNGLPTVSGWLLIICLSAPGLALIMLSCRCPGCRLPVKSRQWKTGRCPHCGDSLN